MRFRNYLYLGMITQLVVGVASLRPFRDIVSRVISLVTSGYKLP